MTALLIPAFLLGLMSSFHCVAMCGPIALAVPSRRHSPAGKMLGHAVAEFRKAAHVRRAGRPFRPVSAEDFTWRACNKA
jgi:hypothetical protein